MARKVVPLTDTEIKKAKPAEKDYKLFDGGGLFLLIKPTGGKLWRLKYLFEGKEKLISLGTYPETTLAEARAKRDEYKREIAKGIDPSAERKESKAKIEEKVMEEQAAIEGQFHRVAYEWLNSLNNDESTHNKRVSSFEKDIFPYLCTYNERHSIISSKHIKDITHPELLKIIKTKEKTAPEVAIRRFRDCNRLWRYAINHGYTESNITDRISSDAFAPRQEKHFAKITDEKILGELLRGIEDYKGEGGVIVRNILRFVSIMPLRADNLCKLRWDQVDFEKSIITISRSEMKVKDQNLPDFVLPLPRQAINILKEVREITGWGQWVFHGVRNNLTHANKESGNKALRSLGFIDEVNGRKQTLHSFRGTFRSLSETHAKEHGVSFEVRERVLDHHEENKVIRAYTHKADYTEQMRELMQWWADFLDQTKVSK
ncbi:MAG: integrase arm-type DNA-binding domain-containing protein [Campylobacterota bacterium]